MELARDGAELFPAALDEAEIGCLERAFEAHGAASPGTRLHGDLGELGSLLAPGGRIGGLAATILGRGSRPVRVLLFNKSPATNWALGFHQDRTIAVAEWREVDGFTPWTVKNGQVHVQPPQSVIDVMLTLRVHLDDVGEDAAPLRILPGSHRLGRLNEAAIEELAVQTRAVDCTAKRGDIWLYATAIVHGSDAFRASRGQRRVLQVDYAAADLPGGLRWTLLSPHPAMDRQKPDTNPATFAPSASTA